LDPETKKYVLKNHIDFGKIENKHLVSISNFSMFGCTLYKGLSLLHRHLEKRRFNIVLLEYGGNDCDFNWAKIAEAPHNNHTPNTPFTTFIDLYIKMIKQLRDKLIEPIITTLLPLEPQRFFDWFCTGLNKDNILKWLGTVNTIYRWQEKYSRAIERIGILTNTVVIDLRGAFLNQFKIDDLLCEDGVHPNTKGQGIITETFLKFSMESNAEENMVFI
jgi:lysophospholipase L1-like esterase